MVTQTHGVSEKRPEKKQTSKENGGSQLNREVNTSSFNFMTHNQALKDLMDLTGSVTHAKLPSETTMGDCNKNLIRGVVSPLSDSKLIGVTPPSSNKLNV
uniref:Uncharacterized protein n=1 Tax=Cyprinodon variegatus TaxID=28743 RepID=A0A3Q2GCQ3_CYPVA